VRLSQAYIPTQKEIPSDAVIPSHQLMLRAGFVKPLAAGIYSILPIGWKIMKKIMEIIRHEMDSIGAQELHLPALNPIELWNESGRNENFGDEMFRLKDRKGRELALAPTHEEIICDLARKYIRSYKDLPQIWYQIQTKFRDEPRPRSGVMRTRQFTMKDSYSMDADPEGMKKSYDLHAEAYKKIFSRCGIKFHIVGASSGLMGGRASQEFMMESEHGEDLIVLCDKCGYATNMEVAVSNAEDVQISKSFDSLTEIHTPDKKTIQEVSSFLNIKPYELIKSIVYIKNKNEPVIALIRGDHEINEEKLSFYLEAPIRPAHSEEVKNICGAEVGFIGPIGFKDKNSIIIADNALKNMKNLIAGANKENYHLGGINVENDLKNAAFFDIRNVVQGDTCKTCGSPLRITNAIELGHIFQLGTRYASAMKTTFLDSSGKENPVYMGSYGIGVERLTASIIEQNHDAKGMVWEPFLTPFHVHIIPINVSNEEIVKESEAIYSLCTANSIDALIDDRNVSPGFKFKDADLLGMPIQIIVGKKWIEENKIEFKIRKTGETFLIDSSNIIDKIKTLLSINGASAE